VAFVAISSNEKVLLAVALLNTAGIFIHIGISYYFAYSKMEVMLFHLRNCPAVTHRVPSLKLGASGRMYVFIAITAVLAMPRRLVRIGSASAEDIENFPLDLKRKIIMLYWSCFALALVMLILTLIIEFEII
jgi:hypothetical protein